MTNILAKAFATADADKACKLIQDALGITDGGLAALHVFDRERWANTTPYGRCCSVVLWLEQEAQAALPEADRLAKIVSWEQAPAAFKVGDYVEFAQDWDCHDVETTITAGERGTIVTVDHRPRGSKIGVLLHDTQYRMTLSETAGLVYLDVAEDNEHWLDNKDEDCAIQKVEALS